MLDGRAGRVHVVGLALLLGACGANEEIDADELDDGVEAEQRSPVDLCAGRDGARSFGLWRSFWERFCGRSDAGTRDGGGPALDGGPSTPDAGLTDAGPSSPTRADLSATADAFLESFRDGGVASVLASGARVTENAREIAVEASLLAGTRTYPYRVFFAEPGAGQLGLFGVADVGASPMVFSARLKVSAGKASEVEIVTARTGEAAIVAPQALKTPHPMYETVVPAAQRSTRDEAIAAADAYFDGIEKADGTNVPFTEDCNRVENGVQSTNNPTLSPLTSLSCRDGLPLLNYIKTIRDRRYPLFDEERGLLWGLAVFDIPGGPYHAEVGGTVIDREQPAGSLLIAEVFKIVDGKIQRMEAVMRNAPLSTPSGWPSQP